MNKIKLTGTQWSLIRVGDYIFENDCVYKVTFVSICDSEGQLFIKTNNVFKDDIFLSSINSSLYWISKEIFDNINNLKEEIKNLSNSLNELKTKQ